MSTIQPGAKVGPYEILALLGSGGIGEVWKARDSRLNRDAALKILRYETSGSESYRARFAIEARAVAALNHPNIVSIFDFGEEQGTQFTISELIQGESLRATLSEGAVPVRKLLDIAAQVADGLSAAHAAQIAHRDLKPENIMIAPGGRVKILDFGLARQSSDGASGGTATLTIQTQAGTVLGTPSYMSPEQARGIPADYRSDQFSFGLILHELATGTRAFDRESTVETLAAIVRDEPAPIKVALPPPLRWAIDRCLAKDPRQRYDSTRDLYQELRALRDHLSEMQSGAAAEAGQARPRGVSGLWSFRTGMEVIVGLTLLIAVFLGFRLSRGEDISKRRFTPFAMSSEAISSALAWSPDGKAIAWTEGVGEQTQVFARYLNAATPSQITRHAKWAGVAGWSADSRRVFFAAPASHSPEGKEILAMYSVSIVGGEPELLSVLPDFTSGGSLSPDARTIAVVGRNEGNIQIWISSPVGSPFRPYEPAPFASPSQYNVASIEFSPDGRKLLFIRTGDSQIEEAWLLPIPQAVPHRVFTQLPKGRLHQNFSWMPDSRHVAITLGHMEPSRRSHIWMLDTESSEARQLTTGTSVQAAISASPDGRRLAFAENKFDLDIINVTLRDGVVSRLIATDAQERMPAWSGHSSQMAYVTDRKGSMEIWLRSADGQDRPIVTPDLFSDGGTQFFMNPALSPDGETIVFSRINELGQMRAWVMPISTRVPERLSESANSEYVADWAADGKRVAANIVDHGIVSLATLKLGSRDRPFIVRQDVDNALSAWSPNGEWLTYRDKRGWNLTSPAGKVNRPLGNIATAHLMFSSDGKLLYGIRREGNKNILFSFDIAGKSTHDIRDLGKDIQPASDYDPGIRFALTPDGKSLTCAIANFKSSLWLLDGFRPTGWFDRLFQ